LTEIVSIERDEAEAARSALERCLAGGGIAVFPADGLYGLACDPLDGVAIERIHRLKGRDEGKPAAVMYLSPLAMRELVEGLGPRTRAAVGALLPGPVTLVVANPERRYPLACREDPERLGVRLIGGPLAGVMRPLFQTSANRSGEPPPTRFEDVPAEIVAAADLAIDGGVLGGLPSTVVDLSRLDASGEWTVLRDGALSVGNVGRVMSELPENLQSAPLAEVDPEIGAVLERELRRQQGTLEMIASENFVPQAVLEAAGSVLTNKYAEGYPGRRYYGGCEEVDVAERLAIDRAKALFGADHANVQPHAGAQANNAAYMALIEPGDTIMGMALDHGGHLTHGMKLNVSGKLYEAVAYHVRREDLLVDMEEVERLAREHEPKVIVAGWSAYPRQLDFAAFREIADSVGAKLMVDMAHFAGLVAAGLHPNPVEHADVVTTTIHKTLCGPRSGMILCREEHAQAVDKAIFPGQQGGPLMHIIAAKAVALRIAATEPFRARQRQTIANAQALAEGLQSGGLPVLTGGTDVHLVLVDLTPTELDGKTAESRLEEVGITVNRNAIPFDERPPMNPSGLRIGTPALTTRGLVEDDMREIAAVICAALSGDFEAEKDALAERTKALMDRFPLYPQLSAAAV
jgi:glycine hydroxymethyltransferase